MSKVWSVNFPNEVIELSVCQCTMEFFWAASSAGSLIWVCLWGPWSDCIRGERGGEDDSGIIESRVRGGGSQSLVLGVKGLFSHNN